MRATPNIDFLRRQFKTYQRRHSKLPVSVEVDEDMYSRIRNELASENENADTTKMQVDGVTIIHNPEIEPNKINMKG